MIEREGLEKYKKQMGMEGDDFPLADNNNVCPVCGERVLSASCINGHINFELLVSQVEYTE